MQLTSMMTLLTVLVFFTLVKSQGPHQDSDTFNVTKRAPIPPLRCGRQAKDRQPWFPGTEGPKYLVIGGVKANAHSWPWMVMIRRNGIVACGGTVIAGNGFNSSLILTAAHCVCKIDPRNNESKAEDVYPHDIFQICAASHERRECREPRNVAKIHVHPDYHQTPWTMKYDIAVIKLYKPLTFTDRIRPICLNPDHDAAPPCVITGWGVYLSGGHHPIELQQLSVEPDSKACKKYTHSSHDDTIGICASARENARSGHGDSGGPLACKGANGVWYQDGIISHGKNVSKGGYIAHGLVYAARTKFVKCEGDTFEFVSLTKL